MEKIDHIVVVMLENRSFDCLLGKLYPKSENFNGLSGDEFDLFHGEKVFVWTDPEGGIHPPQDPDDSHEGMMEQIYGDGFCASYETKDPDHPTEVMHYYTPDQVPVLSYLARQYAVSDAWYASAPCSTIPNRFFLHCGTSGISVDDNPTTFPYHSPSVFSRFDDWRIYYSNLPIAGLITHTWRHLEHFQLFEQFKKDASNGTLPGYTFIEPAYYWNDQHPPSDILFGEAFIADIYNTLQASPMWEKTLLVIMYDEHGGIFDHVKPPAAIPPEPPKAGQTFAFNSYGVRLPVVVVSPLIPPGTIFRAEEGTQPYDHTSILSTLRKRFNLGAPLSDREAGAPDLWPLLTLGAPTNLGQPVTPLPVPPEQYQVASTTYGFKEILEGALPLFVKDALLK